MIWYAQDMHELNSSAKDIVIHSRKGLELDDPSEIWLCFGAMKASVDLNQSLF